MTNAEDLKTLTTVNEDGSKSLYVYDQPIKFIDEETNKIEYIDSSMVKKESAYVNKANSFETSIPISIDEGIKLSDEKYSLEMLPKTLGNEIGILKTVEQYQAR